MAVFSFLYFLRSSLFRIKKYPLYTAINILGLCMAFFVVIFLYVVIRHETSYDLFNKKADRIFRVNHDERGMRPEGRFLATVGPPVGPAIKQSYPEVENTVRVRYSPGHVVKAGEKMFNENEVFYVDSSFFEIFTMNFEEGFGGNALSKSNSVVLTRETALKYFGTTDVVGQTLVFDDNNVKQITGVLSPVPKNSHLHFDFLFPFDDFIVPHGYPVTLNDWGWISFHTYILLKRGVNYKDLENKLVSFRDMHWPVEKRNFQFRLQPLKNIYFGEPKNEIIRSGNYKQVKILFIGGIVLLLLALFNYTNITTALSLSRAKEIGVRKVLGSSGGSIRFQLILESLLFSFIALIIALFFAFFFFHRVLSTIGFEISLTREYFFSIVLMLLGVCIITGLIAGWYPAIILSSYNPIKVLKGKLRGLMPGIPARNILFPFQIFGTTILLILSAFIFLQTRFLRSKGLGYQKEGIIVLRFPGNRLETDFANLRNRFLQGKDILEVSAAGGRLDGEYGSVPINFSGNTQPHTISIAGIYPRYFSAIGAKMVAGREMNEMSLADTARTFIINESAAKMMGWTKEQAIGQKVTVDEAWTGEVIGVVADFNFASLYEAITPQVSFFPKSPVNNIYVRIREGTGPSSMKFLQSEWKKSGLAIPFDAMFLSDYINNLYQKEQNLSRIIYAFCFVAVLICFFGLFGMISLMIRFRSKELGVRKVLGAGLKDIAARISKDFLLLALIASVLALPVSVYAVHLWLNQFQYRIDVQWSVFIVAVVFNFCIVLLNVLAQTIKNASLRPVRALRDE